MAGALLQGDFIHTDLLASTEEWQNNFNIDALLLELDDVFSNSHDSVSCSSDGVACTGEGGEGDAAAASSDFDHIINAAPDDVVPAPSCNIMEDGSSSSCDPNYWPWWQFSAPSSPAALHGPSPFDYYIRNGNYIAQVEEQGAIANKILAPPHHQMIPQAPRPAISYGDQRQYRAESSSGFGFAANSPYSYVDIEANIEDVCKAHHCRTVQHKASPQVIEDALDQKRTRKPKKKLSMHDRRQLRVAFIVESQSDDIGDGYKWRKYGQKQAKKCPYPRNYYRCRNSACSVKKRTERFVDNPRMLLLTYEGQHNHNRLANLYGVDFACFATHNTALIKSI